MKDKLKKTIIVLMTNIIIFQITGVCYASKEQIKKEIKKIEEGTLPYHYQNEMAENYEILEDENNKPIYSLQKGRLGENEQLDEEEKIENEQYKQILENGYPFQAKEELGCNTEIEAYLATQLAIHLSLEKKKVDDYIADNEMGQRILKASKQIIKQDEKKVVDLELVSPVWKESNLDPDHKYLEYQAKIQKKVKDLEMKVPGYMGVMLQNEKGENITTAKDQEIVRVVAPTNHSFAITIQLKYRQKKTEPYILSNSFNSSKQYLIGKESFEEKEKTINNQMYNITVINRDSKTKEPIKGNSFFIYNDTTGSTDGMRETNQEGKIETKLLKGKYYIKQAYSIPDYEIQKEILKFEVTGNETITVYIDSSPIVKEEINTSEKEYHVTEENKNIIENQTVEVVNIETSNINKEIIRQINETNLYNENYFINTINKINRLNLKKKNVYQNEIEELQEQNQILEGANEQMKMSRNDFINYIDLLKLQSFNPPNLPVASKQ